jgi:hypothetical protein
MALVFTAGTILFCFMFPSDGLFRAMKMVLTPVLALVSILPRASRISVWGLDAASLLLGFAYFYGLWFLVICGLRRASRQLKVVLVLCVLLGIAGWCALKAYAGRIDWTSRGLNPARPGFAPAVVLLAGTFDYGFTSSITGEHRAGAARFEIRMRGADFYYAERWTGSYGKYGSWDSLALALGKSCFTWNRSYSGSGHHGRGGGGDDRILVARRLWRGEEFVGATAANSFASNGVTERFLELKQFGRFQIPGRIEFSDGERHEILHVRRVEFLGQPGTNWFYQIKQKYLDHLGTTGQPGAANLDEAGWSGEQ